MSELIIDETMQVERVMDNEPSLKISQQHLVVCD